MPVKKKALIKSLSLMNLQLENTSSASKRLRSSMTIATSTKSKEILIRHPNTLTSLMQMVIADFGQLMVALPMRRVTAWLRTACSTTVFTRETRSTLDVMHLPLHGKPKLQLREPNAGSKNTESALKLKPRLTTMVSKQITSVL